MDKPNPKYKKGDHVIVRNWTGSETGVITDVDWIYHHRTYSYTWRYKVKTESGKTGLTLIYIPEGYLKKLPE